MADVVAVDPFTGKALTVRDKSRDASWYEEGLKSKGVMPGMYGFSPHGDIYTSPYLPPGPSSTNNPAAQDRGNRAGPLVTGLTNPPNTAAMPIAKSTATPSAAFSKTVPDMRGVSFGIGSRDTVGQRTAGLGFRPPQMDNGALGFPMSQTMAAILGTSPAYSGQRGVIPQAGASPKVAQALASRTPSSLKSEGAVHVYAPGNPRTPVNSHGTNSYEYRLAEARQKQSAGNPNSRAKTTESGGTYYYGPSYL